ncbi:hypothetical protein HUG10_01860 [Halorarum halophilum]|uniref:Gamma-glutamyl:cysteine ligase YbdK, ATP-grasp superfamily n=1 Tax=Halorarum halophilum TaxID=2743090 RepID=A0A7D5KKS6_9EURY|nr:hypothetical protein [Halobaculum halophilum]QLG26362.1 hypothetical protein HUG10_01860 [Halobaculum halophilum]
MTDLVDQVRRSLREDTQREFDRRVEDQADRLREALREGRLDSPGFGLGIELEAYAVDGDGRLARVPESVFDADCERELGRHGVEFHTAPDPFDGEGISAQAETLRRHVRNVRRVAAREGLEVVLDAMWTVPPSEGTPAYLGDVIERDGVTIAENMTRSPRYCAIDNEVLARTGGTVGLSVPGAECDFPSILFESLTNSIQPHVQVPTAEAFPRYYGLAVRTLGPVLALATNSPLLPTDLYDVDDPYRLLDETYHELRIPVFEQSVNAAWEKVRFPDGIRTASDAVDALVADPTCAPFLREWIDDDERGDAFADRFWEFDHKRGTYWRWLRTVIGGQPVGGGDSWSIRLEYRPLPTQPTVVDNVGFQCLVAGLVRGLGAADHPLASLDRDLAERSFYSAVENGLDADLAWVTADSERTTDRAVIFDELFALARRGLREQGVPQATVEEYLAPIEERWAGRTTPSRWKLERVRDHLDAGQDFEEAVREMQSEYVRLSGTGEPFVRWS